MYKLYFFGILFLFSSTSFSLTSTPHIIHSKTAVQGKHNFFDIKARMVGKKTFNGKNGIMKHVAYIEVSGRIEGRFCYDNDLMFDIETVKHSYSLGAPWREVIKVRLRTAKRVRKGIYLVIGENYTKRCTKDRSSAPFATRIALEAFENKIDNSYNPRGMFYIKFYNYNNGEQHAVQVQFDTKLKSWSLENKKES